MAEEAELISRSLLDQLRSKLKESTLVTPSDEGYNDCIKRWSEAAVKRAGAVLFPSAEEDIAAAVVWAQENAIDLAVCCGGHGTAGASSSHGGLVVDLSKMRRVTVDPGAKTITAQGGALWAHVDEAAQPYRLATVGGTVNHTGIGGLTLQGGYGWLSGKYGLTIDNLLSVRMVLADGSIVTASQNENSDLFWAVRGAGSNFGIAVEFVYKGHDQKQDPWFGIMAFSPDKLESVIGFANAMVNKEEGRSAMIVAFGSPPPTLQPGIVAIVFHDGPASSARQVFKPLLDIEPLVDDTSVRPYKFLNSMANPLTEHGDRKSTKGFTYNLPLVPEVARKMFDRFQNLVTENPDAVKTLITLEFFYTGVITQVPSNMTAFANRGNHENALEIVWWTDPANDQKFREWSQDFKMSMEQEIQKRGVPSRPAYANYQEEGDERSHDLWGANYDRLQKLKILYDPTNFFNKSHPITRAAL